MKTNTSKIAGYLATVAVLLGGCATFQVSGEIQKGRYALRGRQPEIAAGHFTRAAALDPDFVLPLGLRESVSTYLGRAQYEAGNFADARRALETALRNNSQSPTAQLYLGLTSLRQGNRELGRRDTETGLRAIASTIDAIAAGNTDVASYWDPSKRIRGEIQQTLASSASGKLSDGELIAACEWIGKNFDEEAEKAQADQWRDIQRRSRDN